MSDDIKTVEKINTKVREIARYNPKIKEIVKNANASATLRETKDGFVLESIKYFNYDILCVTSKSVTIHPEHGNIETVFSYNGWEEFFAI